MEKFSSVEHIVGNVPETEKEEILRDVADRFDHQVFEDLKGKEREKTPEELQIIFLANEATNEIRRKYVQEDLDIPPNNIHVLTEKAWLREKSFAFHSASYCSMLQGVVAREQTARIVFMKNIFHEMLHFKSYNALQITTAENSLLDEYRLGLAAHTRDGKRTYFNNLNEAVTEEVTKRFVTNFFDNPLFAEEVKQTRDIIMRNSQAVANSGEPLFNEDTVYAEVKDKKIWSQVVNRFFDTNINTQTFTYQSERRVLNSLIDKLFQRNQSKFQDREEVFEIFVKGMMTGNILSLGRLIERTFGKGTFRRIGELDQDVKIQEAFINSL